MYNMDCADPEVLDERVVYRHGSFVRKHRWLRGAHPNLGTIIMGLTGEETLQEVEVIVPFGTITVLPASPSEYHPPRR